MNRYDTLSSAKQDLGQCQVCNKSFTITKKGVLRHHKGAYSRTSGRWGQRCDGAGRPAKVPRDRAVSSLHVVALLKGTVEGDAYKHFASLVGFRDHLAGAIAFGLVVRDDDGTITPSLDGQHWACQLVWP